MRYIPSINCNLETVSFMKLSHCSSALYFPNCVFIFDLCGNYDYMCCVGEVNKCILIMSKAKSRGTDVCGDCGLQGIVINRCYICAPNK